MSLDGEMATREGGSEVCDGRCQASKATAKAAPARMHPLAYRRWRMTGLEKTQCRMWRRLSTSCIVSFPLSLSKIADDIVARPGAERSPGLQVNVIREK